MKNALFSYIGYFNEIFFLIKVVDFFKAKTPFLIVLATLTAKLKWLPFLGGRLKWLIGSKTPQFNVPTTLNYFN